MDFKESFEAAKIPIICIVILEAVAMYLSDVSPKVFGGASLLVLMPPLYILTIGVPLFLSLTWLQLVNLVIGLILLILLLLIYLWVGYRSVKKFKSGVGGAALTGMVTAFIVSLVNTIMWIVIPASTLNLGLLFAVLVINVISWVGTGTLVGGLGGFIAKRTRKAGV